jgi:hypothetical protein
MPVKASSTNGKLGLIYFLLRKSHAPPQTFNIIAQSLRIILFPDM